MQVTAYWLEVPDDQIEEALAAGLIAERVDHGILAVSAQATPDQLEAWHDARKRDSQN